MLRKCDQGQGLLEFMVLGSVMIFLLSSIIGNAVNSIIETRQVSGLVKKALKASLASGTRAIQASYMYVEDRIAPGVARYGEIDRMPLTFSGSGLLSIWMFYGERGGGSTPYVVNGKSYHLPSTSNSSHQVTVQDGFSFTDVETVVGEAGLSLEAPAEVRARLNREKGQFCKKVYRGSLGFDSTCLSCFDLNRLGQTPTLSVASQLSWQWQCVLLQDVYKEFRQNREQPLLYDINGDLLQEKLTMIKTNPDGTYQISFQMFQRSLKKSSCVSEGFRAQAQMLTYGDGISLSIQETSDMKRNPMRTVKSHFKKRQTDLIERQYQINRGVRASAGGIVSGGVDCRSAHLSSAVCATDSDSTTGCCYSVANRERDCLDQKTNILYMRSVIPHNRQSIWIQKRQL